ncbi:MAG: hypothetical protein ACPG5B_05925 [Chitinophagales bacterium]
MKLTKKINGLLFITFVFVFSCTQNIKKSDKKLESLAVNQCDCYSQSSLYNIPIHFDNQVPGDLQSFNNQSQVDCFSWQEFISLNWPVDTTHSFGQPRDTSFVQWETYIPKDVLFQPGGVAPPAWGTLISDEYNEKFKKQKLSVDRKNTKLLSFTSKFSKPNLLKDIEKDLGFEEAAPFNGPNWLGAQNGTNVWYEILLNKDFYDFVTERHYYNAAVQHDSARACIPLNFPKGVYNGATGAIELKVAWMEVPNPESEQWNRYKLSVATVLDPTTDSLRTTTVALVGMNILHKTTNQPTWVWSTFEHIDNSPEESEIKQAAPPYGYNFYNSECKAQNINVADSTVTVSCTPNTSPPYYLSEAKPVPIQIVKSNPIDQVDAAPINAKMQAAIKGFYPNSVWQYYELIDVIWSKQLQPDFTTPKEAPRQLNVSAMTSGASIVANTTMESYVQTTNTCFSCHVCSHIAPFPADSVNNNIFGDFSFAIKFAKYSQSDIKKWSSDTKK